MQLIYLRVCNRSRWNNIKDYVDGKNSKGNYQFKLKVYGKINEPCGECNNLITKSNKMAVLLITVYNVNYKINLLSSS